ncbi:MAG: acyltransferase 3 [Pedosphaera sp.]|nr:acyltransferase 3 [Pedosphaera sp.]
MVDADNPMPAVQRRAPAKHFEALDGFRGLAILAVLIYHFFMGWPFWTGHLNMAMGHFLRTGWVGVDLFFVLSGFLITGILLGARTDQHRWRNFIMRRALRIFPLYYLALIISFLVIPACYHATQNAALQVLVVAREGAAPWFFGYLSNVILATTNVPFPLHLSLTWSLAAEEQFYLIWPAIIWLTPPRYTKRMILGVIALAQVFKLLAYYLLPHGTLIEFLTPCRLDEFGFGALIALALRDPGFSDNNWIAFRRFGLLIALPIGFGLIALQQKISPFIIHFYGQFLVAWGAAACILVLVRTPDSLAHRLFSSTLLRQFGKYSYCMYLCHGLLVPFLGIESAPANTGGILFLAHVVARLAIYFVIVYLVSALSFRFFEKPIQNLKRFFEPVPQPDAAARLSPQVQTQERP